MSPTPSPSLDARAAGRPRRRRRRLGLVGLAVAGIVGLTGCLPGIPFESWVPDGNGDGTLDPTEIVAAQQSVAARWAASLEAHRRQVQLHPFLVCVRRHESDRGAFPHDDGYGAQNRRSTASGAYQFLDSTWRSQSARAGYPGYARARHAPWYVQDAVALHTYQTGGRSHWRSSRC